MPSYSRVTLTNLRDRLTEKVGNNSIFWTAEEKRDAINEALCVWQLMTGEFSKTFALGVGSGTVFYAVPKQIASVNRVLFNGIPISPISLWELDMGKPGWQGVTGTPQFWTPVGIDQFTVYPQPTSGNFRLEGYSESPRLNADGDFLQVGDEELTRLLDYAHHYLTFKEGIPEMQATMGGFKRFLKAVSLRNARILATTFYRKFMGLVRDERERVPRSPSGAGGVRETA